MRAKWSESLESRKRWRGMGEDGASVQVVLKEGVKKGGVRKWRSFEHMMGEGHTQA